MIEDEDGFRTAGINGRDYLWKCWLKNKGPPAVLRERAKGALWQLSPAERQAQKLSWQHQMYASEREEVALALKTIKTARDEIKGLQQTTDANILSKARVIGCTTTKAAMCKSLLNGVGAGILLVEEAGEIREADVLTSLSQSTKRLIMIGDHKQLRPKCQYYPLTVESNRGFDLNRSLFERLAIAPGFRLATLGVQHRMHPEISSIPRLVTYNDLADAPTVTLHPAPLGLGSRVIFANHTSPEDAQNVDALESVSKTNAHERAMILKTVQYVLKQGYSHDDIAVLTPYLGQMMKLQAELRKCVGVSLDDRDLNEAREQFRGDDNFSEELAAAKKGDSNSKSIRVATIDNFQGEEAKIILISLVRSNDLGQIGFLKEPERVNVMLSRARECEIIFGNRATLERAKGTLSPLKGGLLWKTIFSHLDASGHVFEGLPVLCQNHSTRAILSSSTDFDTYCRDGGCTKKCLKERDGCNHPCQQNCHPGPCPKCPVLCPDVCLRGHPLSKRCSAEVLPKCHRNIIWTCPMGHRASGPCHKGKFGSECKICTDIRLDEDACIKREEELTKELEDKHHRLAAVKRKVEDAKQSNAHRKELKDIEKELTLAQKELDGFLALEPEIDTRPNANAKTAGDDITSDVVERNVLTLLQKQNQVCLSNFSSTYRDEFGSCFDDDAEKCMSPKNKKRRKLKNVLQCMPFCETVPSKNRNQYDVRLRGEYNETERPSKVQKSKPVETVASDNDQEPVDAVIGVENLQHTTDRFKDDNVVTFEPSKSPPQQDHQQQDQQFSTDSVSSSILPPMSSMESMSTDCEAAVVAVLQRYIAEGALKADNLLDEIPITSNSIDAMRFMIELELNPGGSTSSPPFKQTSSNICNALLLTARALDVSKKLPLQAREYAQKALSFIQDGAVNNYYPKSWAAELKSICEPPLNPRTKRSSVGEPSSTVSEAWLEVKRKDPKAPDVMSDAILPLTGLEAVKDSLLSMYHRFKLSQEQGDGSAASYNVRFEGNPGSVLYACCVVLYIAKLTRIWSVLHLSWFLERGRQRLHATMGYFCSS